MFCRSPTTATGQVGVDGPQWTEINGGGVYANPDDYLKLEGGKLTGIDVTVDRSSGTAFKVKKSGVDHVKIEAGGKIFCNYNMALDDDPTTVPNKGWVHEQIEAAFQAVAVLSVSTTAIVLSEPGTCRPI